MKISYLYIIISNLLMWQYVPWKPIGHKQNGFPSQLIIHKPLLMQFMFAQRFIVDVLVVVVVDFVWIGEVTILEEVDELWVDEV